MVGGFRVQMFPLQRSTADRAEAEGVEAMARRSRFVLEVRSRAESHIMRLKEGSSGGPRGPDHVPVPLGCVFKEKLS